MSQKRRAGKDRSLEGTIRRHPAGKRLSPEAADAIVARSVCPTCDGREPDGTEEGYATCIFCATGTKKPVLPDASLTAKTDENAPVAPVVPLRPAAWAPDEPFALD